jgi:acyl transferase domain-containing protein/NAD(P)H-dependent flavin oxidoreductase YrpB (nitropropane dioxygenase family)
VGITPFREPNADLVVAIERAGGLGVLDLGTEDAAARAALDRVRSRWGGPFGVRIAAGCPLSPADLPAEVDTILIGPDLTADIWWTAAARRDGAKRLIAEVTSPGQAAEAQRRGADGLVARGFEAGGPVGVISAFVLVQHLAAEFDLPVWAMGGIGPHAAAAAVAGGARGVVIDAQLALVAEAGLPGDVAAAIAAMDGSETTVTGGHRVYTRPDLPVIAPEPGSFGARSLRGQLLPVGQDGAVAAPLAARFKTAGGVVRAISAAITSQIELAARIQPLADAVPVQGPMTRVSDRAEFAAAVAQAGGLPFLALALMPGDETRRLLTETAERLGGLRWGVGILGFAPEDVRTAQLEALKAARPPYALIAGGQPFQAAALEAAGIETFLHVPSPGLLDRFLTDGSRRFVFEGAECGGHIGPRGSFALWEAQISRLLECPDLHGMRVWFAGGVHDERSAAMVAAMAAPLAERGAQIGVLMGTAYLFTEEAVRSGAILPGYQQAARDCAGTALLETSPGHVVRCADTPYVTSFAEARQQLSDGGASQQESWAELERLNLGRLRIAAKGLRRDGDALITVAGDVQQRDGMFMLGEVATLRDEPTTVAALHQQVTVGAADFLAVRAAGLREAGLRDAGEPAARPLDVAIVGMACVFPGADGLREYWANVLAGADAITSVPPDRWRPEAYPGVPSARGGFLRPVPFDALGYGIPPSSLASIEPVQLLALEVAARALADAGYAERPFDSERTSVIFGAESGSDLSAAYGLRSALPSYAGSVPAEFDEHLPRLTEDSFPGVLSNVIAGRIANRLDLGGVNYTVDAACASSLAALDLACKELAAGTSDLVLCGGADTHNGIGDFEMFASVQALSPSGRCAPFDAAADGIALGEGAACVALKRLADAERDGDRVYAVIKGVAGSSDGRSLGLTAPRPEGQRRALDRAYAMAGISPAAVGMIEAHGTGTVVGDRAELATLTAMFTESGAEPASCMIGSVKSQIGHTKCAAGLAGLIKIASALHTGVRPGTVHLREPNPYWEPERSPFTFGREPRPWAAEPGARYAGVSAFGFGGTNFHAVLAGYDGADEPAHGLPDWPAELFVLRGDVAAAAERLRRLVQANDVAGRPWRLAELAATMAAGNEPVRAAFVATDLEDLAVRLRGPLPGPAAAASSGSLAFLFPGQGSQRPGMLGELFTAFPRLQRLLRLAGGRYADVMFPPAAFTREDRERNVAAITDTRMAQPTLGIAGLAMHELLGALGVHPDLAGGHSYGELLALCAAGAYDEADLLELSEIRARAILAAAGDDPGAMAAVSAPAAQVREVLASTGLDGTGPVATGPGASGVVLANHNAPGQAVISGPTAAVDAAVAALAERGIPARRLPVACAFHSPLVAPAAATLAAELAGRAVRPPRFPVFANSTAAPYPDTADAVREILAGQVAEPVRFAEQVEAMYEAGARTFVEAGPGRVLTGLVGKILGDRPHTAVACDVPGENGLHRLLTALAGLIGAGVPVDPAILFGGRAEPVAGTPRRPQWTVDGHLVRTVDGQPLPGGLQPAGSAPQLSLGRKAPPASDRDKIVTEFLRTTRELVAAQRDVVLGYLGAAPAPMPAPGREPTAAAAPGAGSTPGAQTAEPAPSPALAGAAQPGEAADPRSSAAHARNAAHAGNAAHPGYAAHPGNGAAQPAGEPVPAGRAEIAEAVTDVVSARTGYPRDMLGTDLDLEADLSIDSIKRTEIIGALAERLRLPGSGAGADESVVGQLAQIKTIGGIAAWLTDHNGRSGENGAPGHNANGGTATDGAATRAEAVVAAAAGSIPSAEPTLPGGAAGLTQGARGAESPGLPAVPAAAGTVPGAEATFPAGAGTVPGPTLPAGTGAEATGAQPAGARTGVPERYVVEAVEVAAADGVEAGLEGPVLIVDDGRGIALELGDLLEQRGAEAVTVDLPAAAQLADAAAFVHLGALRPGAGPLLPEGFEQFRGALAGTVRTLLVATGTGGTFGHGYRETPGDGDDLGLRGLIRTIAAEYPQIAARAVDVDPKESPRAVAAQLLAELTHAGGPSVVGYRDGRRTSLAVRLAEPLTSPPDRLDLDHDSVVLLTGGARGITAAVALGLARATGCHIELIGRTSMSGGPSPELASAADPAALRRLLIERGMNSPREIEAEVGRIGREREVRATLEALRAVAASVRYHALDVRDGAAVGGVLDDIYARYGRLDGVIHGAGLVEDRLLSAKTPESFSRVYGTKVDGARALAGRLRGDVRFTVLFGSVSGVFGNRGQADYAAANDALDSLAHLWSARLPGRVVSLDWGPWAGGGMVGPELERQYARRGVTLIDPEAGVAALLAELAAGSGPAQVVYMCGEAADE